MAATSLGRKTLPSGFNPPDFKYSGRPASSTSDFDDDVGIADMACVNQFGESNNSKYYHVGVVESNGEFFVYTEWGRIKGGKSWNGGGFTSQDYTFFKCDSEAEARKKFKSVCKSKNTARVEQKEIGGKTIWAAKSGKDGYIVQKLATRERGLPDAYSIKDSSGVQVTSGKKKTARKKTARKSSKTYHREEIRLATDLVGGTKAYARAAQAATSIVPTMEAIVEVRDDYIPAALQLISKIGNDVEDQIVDPGLIDLSKLVAAMVPRVIPLKMAAKDRAKATILSADNIFALQQDLDAFEAALQGEDFDTEDDTPAVDVDSMLGGAKIKYVDPKSTLGRWIMQVFPKMSNDRHYNMMNVRIKSIFEVSRPKLDAAFVESVKEIAKKRKRHPHERAGLQPRSRNDLSDISDYVDDANVAFLFHGTRSVNVAPILRSDLRLPKSLKGVRITGAAFGHGIYWASDFRKSLQYCSTSRGMYSGGDGGISGRGAFLFLSDVVLGKAHMATSAWSISDLPRGSDSVYANNRHCRSLANDEHVTWGINGGPSHRLRYILEVET